MNNKLLRNAYSTLSRHMSFFQVYLLFVSFFFVVVVDVFIVIVVILVFLEKKLNWM